MPEVRQDPLTGRRVIIAEDRAGRPDEFDAAPARHIAIDCPFCAGSEHATPASLARYPAEPAPWQVRVVPNKYPAINVAPPEADGEIQHLTPGADGLQADNHLHCPQPQDPLRQDSGNTDAGSNITDKTAAYAKSGAGAQLNGNLFLAAEACGSHEVIIESPEHVSALSELTPQQVKWTFTAFRDRLKAAEAVHDYGIVFKNMGATAGASLLHAHSQLIALSFIPPEVQTQVDNAAAYYRSHGRRLLCDLVAQELQAKTRVIAQTNSFAAYCPFASRFAFEVWVVPKQAAGAYSALSCEDLAELAALTQDITGRMETVLGNPAYNLVLHAAPFHLPAPQAAAQQWRIEIFPRITRTAGFEWGAGCFINPVQPERAAEELREADWSQRQQNTQTGQSLRP